jgi:hypothetical protein
VITEGPVWSLMISCLVISAVSALVAYFFALSA